MKTQHELLRERYEQHKIKNTYSYDDDKIAKEASKIVVELLKETYPNHNFELKNWLMFNDIEKYSQVKFNIDFDYSKRRIEPDGGIIWMDKKYPILISEMKRQGTNDERAQEGKKKQATGNAIERLGKNLMAIQTLYQNDDILPFICFCWGCDFYENTVLCKLYALNNFQALDTIYTDVSNFKRIKPSSILRKKESWTLEEIISKMLLVISNSIEYYETHEGK